MPFTTTRVFHPDWAGHHQAATVGTLTAQCRISTGGHGDWSPTTGPTPGAGSTVYEGPCGFTDLTRVTRPADAAGQAVAEHPYLVSLAADAPTIPLGARVLITGVLGAPHATGMVLTVSSVTFDSVATEHALLCDLDVTNQDPSGEE